MTPPEPTTGRTADVPADLVADVLAQADLSPDRTALRAAGSSLTYGELADRVRATAAGLRRAGLRPGERVLFSVRPRVEGLVLALGVVAAEGSLVLVDPGSTPELFAARLAAAAPTWAATESLLFALSRPLLAPFARRRGLLLPDLARLPVRHVHAGPWLPGTPRGSRRAAALATGPDRVDVRRAPGAEALVVFTSGTTAAPRAVVHTRGSLREGTRLLEGVCAIGPADVVRTDQMLLGLPALVAGGTWCLPDRAPADDVRGFAKGLGEAAVAFLVPADATALLDAVARGEVPAAGPRTLLLGGAPVTAELLDRLAQVLPGTRCVGVYGMTEILPVAVVDGSEKVACAEVQRRGGCPAGDLVGRLLPGVRARLERVEGAGAGAEGIGELVLAGPSLMRGHLGEGAATEHRTGDLARLDAEGRLLLVGRTRDMLIRGTTNVYPGLYEPRLRDLPGVRDAVLVGLPRPGDADEAVVLVVVPDGAVPSTPGRPVLRRDGALLRDVVRALPTVLDHGAMPDHVLLADHVPTSGRSRKPDRTGLVEAVAAALR